MFRLLVNGKEPNRGDETAIKKRLKSLYKNQLIEIALQYKYERDYYAEKIEMLEKEKHEKEQHNI